jgi:hypothetical protein
MKLSAQKCLHVKTAIRNHHEKEILSNYSMNNAIEFEIHFSNFAHIYYLDLSKVYILYLDPTSMTNCSLG